MSNIKEQLERLPAAPGVYKFLDKNKVILYIGKAASLKSRVGSYFREYGKGELDSRLRGNDRKKDGNDNEILKRVQDDSNSVRNDRKFLSLRGGYCQHSVIARRVLPTRQSLDSDCHASPAGSARNDRLETMVPQIHKIEMIETDSVLEALILEANLIKKHQPRFNVKLKDDKAFVNIVITDEEYPAAHVVRQVNLSCHSREGGNLEVVEEEKNEIPASAGITNVFGPFPSAKMAKEAVGILQKIFIFRTCRNLPKRKCLLYDIGQCSAPCIANIPPAEYKKSIKNLTLFLQGRKKSVIKNFEREMAAEAKRENFERAAQLRNQIFALNHIKDIALIKREEISVSAGMTGRLSKGEDKKIHRIEAYDISNIGGKLAVGSMVVFIDGKVASDEYRKFKIKSVEGSNDVAMMKEVLSRRLRRKEWLYPDLIVVDGGKPQFRAVCEAMTEFKVMIPVIAIAKGPTRKKADLIFSANAPRIDLNLIKQLRDESHRFAIKYHRQLRENL